MYAVISPAGAFNGVIYSDITLDIVEHHKQYDEKLALVSAPPTKIDSNEGGEVYGHPTDEQLESVNNWINKKNKEAEISIITVSVDGLSFDGDENSQALMERNAAAMTAEGLKKVSWKLADNTFAEVTAEQLKKAVMLAAAKQREIVVKYG